ncbi:hypothetical protein G9A89_008553 [Geosiphon pyriformis]|nr:hypothetical protein G9A89_008553 [Geosiphon pyriformis]
MSFAPTKWDESTTFGVLDFVSLLQAFPYLDLSITNGAVRNSWACGQLTYQYNQNNRKFNLRVEKQLVAQIKEQDIHLNDVEIFFCKTSDDSENIFDQQSYKRKFIRVSCFGLAHSAEHTDWSYTDFLRLHCDIIINSPSFFDDWTLLNSTWFCCFN